MQQQQLKPGQEQRVIAFQRMVLWMGGYLDRQGQRLAQEIANDR